MRANHYFTENAAPKSLFDGMQGLSFHLMRIVCALQTQILFVKITGWVEMGFVTHYDFWYEISLFLHEVQPVSAVI